MSEEMRQADIEEKPPDRYRLVYLCLIVNGVGVTMPWNMFIIATSYFVDYKLSKEYTGKETPYATYYLSWVGFTYNLTNLMFNWISVFLNGSFRGSVNLRIVSSLSVEIFIFILTIILTSINSRNWPSGFFWCTLISLIVLSMGSAIFQNIVFGMSAQFPSKYSIGLILGCNMSGVFVVIIEIFSKAGAPEIKTAAIFYFSTALVVLLVCLVIYFLLPFNKFYKYYILERKNVSEDPANRMKGNRIDVPYWIIFKKVFLHLFCLFFTLFVTFSVYPVVLSGIKKSDKEFFIPNDYYSDIMCFLTVNVASTFGTLTSHWINWPSSKNLIIFVSLRLLFVPFFFFCNFHPANSVRGIPVLIPNDWVYWIIEIFFAMSSGFFISKSLFYIPTNVESEHKAVAGMFGASVIGTGMFFGAIFSLGFPLLAGGVQFL